MGLARHKDVTTLLLEWRNGYQEALNVLMPLVYEQLHKLAERQLRLERSGHTLQSTAMVHEVYLKLIDQRRVQFKEREHFFAAAAQRKRRSLKRGGCKTMLTLDEATAPPGQKHVDLVALDDLLASLSKIDPQQGRIVELRFFGGLTILERADVLGISTATVSRDWDLARAWLRRELSRNNV